MTSCHFTLEAIENPGKQRGDSLVVATLLAPAQSCDPLETSFIAALTGLLDELGRRHHVDKPITGLVLRFASAGPSIQHDLERLTGLTRQDAATLFAQIEQCKTQLRRLELLPYPVVACLEGNACGPSYELALACHYRILDQDLNNRCGLADLTLGLPPGLGGQVRLVRLLGLRGAVGVLIAGQLATPDEALAAGMVDSLASDAHDAMAQAQRWVESHSSTPVQPRQAVNRQAPSRVVDLMPMLAIAPASMLSPTDTNDSAPVVTLSGAVEGAQTDIDTALRIESRYFVQAALSQTGKNLMATIGLQFASLKPVSLSGVDPVSSIGQLSEQAMDDLTVLCVAQDIACLGHDAIESNNLSACDLIIDALQTPSVDDRQRIAELDHALSEHAIYACTRSDESVAKHALASKRPRRYVGLRLCSPDQRLRLMEIMACSQTDPHALIQLHNFALQLGIVPLVVTESAGSYVDQIESSYLYEAMALLGDAVAPELIENTAIQMGMARKPLAALDQMSLSVIDQRLHQELHELEHESGGEHHHGKPQDHGHGHGHHAKSKKMPESAVYVLEKMAHGFRRLGQSHGAGFYDYDDDEETPELWSGLSAFLRGSKRVEPADFADRMIYAQCLESVHCLNQGVIASRREANLGAVMGCGFPKHLGGPIQLIESIGIIAFTKRSGQLAERYGERFVVPDHIESVVAQASAND